MFKIYDGRESFYQWDLNRKVIVYDPTATEVHFCNKTGDCSLVVEVYEENGLRLANVPNVLLQNSWPIRVYAYCGECFTKTSTTFKVVARSKPADYVYTETEIKKWEDYEKRIAKLEAGVMSAAFVQDNNLVLINPAIEVEDGNLSIPGLVYNDTNLIIH